MNYAGLWLTASFLTLSFFSLGTQNLCTDGLQASSSFGILFVVFLYMCCSELDNIWNI
jgi:hypothetical protein